MDFADYPDHAAIRDAVAGVTQSFGSAYYTTHAGALHERFDGVLDRIMVYAPYPVPAGLWREAGLGAT